MVRIITDLLVGNPIWFIYDDRLMDRFLLSLLHLSHLAQHDGMVIIPIVFNSSQFIFRSGRCCSLLGWHLIQIWWTLDTSTIPW